MLANDFKKQSIDLNLFSLRFSRPVQRPVRSGAPIVGRREHRTTTRMDCIDNRQLRLSCIVLFTVGFTAEKATRALYLLPLCSYRTRRDISLHAPAASSGRTPSHTRQRIKCLRSHCSALCSHIFPSHRGVACHAVDILALVLA